MVVLLYSISVIPLSLVTQVGQPHDAVRFYTRCLSGQTKFYQVLQ